MAALSTTGAKMVRRLEHALSHIRSGLSPETEIRERAEIVLAHLTDVKAPALMANSPGRYILANNRAAVLTGYADDELLRLSVWDLTATNNQADGRRRWQEFVKRGR